MSQQQYTVGSRWVCQRQTTNSNQNTPSGSAASKHQNRSHDTSLTKSDHTTTQTEQRRREHTHVPHSPFSFSFIFIFVVVFVHEVFLIASHQVGDIIDLAGARVLEASVDPVSSHQYFPVHQVVEQRCDHKLATQVFLSSYDDKTGGFSIDALLVSFASEFWRGGVSLKSKNIKKKRGLCCINGFMKRSVNTFVCTFSHGTCKPPKNIINIMIFCAALGLKGVVCSPPSPPPVHAFLGLFFYRVLGSALLARSSPVIIGCCLLTLPRFPRRKTAPTKDNCVLYRDFEPPTLRQVGRLKHQSNHPGEVGIHATIKRNMTTGNRFLCFFMSACSLYLARQATFSSQLLRLDLNAGSPAGKRAAKLP